MKRNGMIDFLDSDLGVQLEQEGEPMEGNDGIGMMYSPQNEDYGDEDVSGTQAQEPRSCYGLWKWVALVLAVGAIVVVAVPLYRGGNRRNSATSAAITSDSTPSSGIAAASSSVNGGGVSMVGSSEGYFHSHGPSTKQGKAKSSETPVVITTPEGYYHAHGPTPQPTTSQHGYYHSHNSRPTASPVRSSPHGYYHQHSPVPTPTPPSVRLL